MTDDKLIEEAFKAHGDSPTWEADPVARDAAIRWHMRGFNDALAVFENAQAEPTEDEEAEFVCGNCGCGIPDRFWEPQAEPVTVTDDMVERAAAGIWWEKWGMYRAVSWSDRVAQEKAHRGDRSWSGPVDNCRRDARAALEAALSPKEETDE